MKINKIKRKIPINKYYARKYLLSLIMISKIIIPLLFCGILVYVLIFSGIFKIKNIIIKGDNIFVDTQDVSILVNTNVHGKNLFLFNSDSLVNDLRNNFLGAKDFIISKRLVNTITIKIVERQPIAIIYKNNDNYYLVDDEGYILGNVDPNLSQLPRIKYEKDLDVGKFIDKNLVPLYNELTAYLQQEDVKASSISFHPNYILFYLNDGQEVYLGNDKDKLKSIRIINSLVKQSILDNKEIERIDLRYDKVIVLFK